MRKYDSVVIISILLSSVFLCAVAEGQGPKVSHTLVRLETTAGVITMELFPEKAPQSAENFLQYVQDGYYDGMIFHRVIKSFMIQTGEVTREGKERNRRPPIKNEAGNGLSNLRGTIAVAREVDPHSGTAQFFVNVADNKSLDFRGQRRETWGYAVFGRVIAGMNVVDAISNGATRGDRNFPLKPIVILKAQLIANTPQVSLEPLTSSQSPVPPEEPFIRASGLMITGDPKMQVDWGRAYNYCSRLELANYNDWRLPTIQEMKKINRETEGWCAPSGIDYPLVTFGCVEYWGADSDGSVALAYGFNDDDVLTQDKGYMRLVLCVRNE